jgi:hypothetical protein
VKSKRFAKQQGKGSNNIEKEQEAVTEIIAKKVAKVKAAVKSKKGQKTVKSEAWGKLIKQLQC